MNHPLPASDATLAARFKERGLPLTQQRRAIYEFLRSSREHPSAEDIYLKLKPRQHGLSLATVYKTLHTLEHLGLARAVDTPHSQTRFDALTGTHHHAICTACGRIEDLFDPRLDALKLPASAGGFEPLDHSVHFRGLCAACRKRAPKDALLRSAPDTGRRANS